MQVRIGPVAFWSVVGALVIMAGWSAVTATYFAFRDDVLTRLIARQAEMQYAYEDRIAELRAQVDRTTSRQLLDQEQFEKKLDQVVRRQTTLESRATAMGTVPDTTVTGSVKPRASLEPASVTPSRPYAITDTVTFIAPPDREARLESRGFALASAPRATEIKGGGLESAVVRLQASLDKVERQQIVALTAMEENYDSRARRMRGVLGDLGITTPSDTPAARGGVGGPFLPVKPGDNNAFERQLHRINISRNQIERLRRTLVQVPYRKPVLGSIETTSSFGVRSDPFLGRPAMHSGLDFRGATGDPVRATAAGKVVAAGWSGGYGKMVEIEHNDQLSTRYGHLSQINVKVGEVVRIGQVVGEIGSTGRSTGPHLHYETRIDGDAVDPQKFLRAGLRLGDS
jgi:murein DD-endopeptidase MepM/ murein hydrolase activator NlpD